MIGCVHVCYTQEPISRGTDSSMTPERSSMLFFVYLRPSSPSLALSVLLLPGDAGQVRMMSLPVHLSTSFGL